MPEFYFASAISIKLLETLPTGFLIEFDEDGIPVLLLKFDNATLTQILKGVPLSLMLNNPNLTNKSISLIIYDNVQEPLWIDGNPPDNYDSAFPQFDIQAIQLIGHKEIKIALYNDLTIPIYSSALDLKYDLKEWDSWMAKVYNDPIFSEPLKITDYNENLWKYQQSFNLKILNVDHTSEEKIKIAYNQWEGDNAGKVSLKDYNFNDYLNIIDGKHGYNQELSIKHILSNYFTIDQEVFVSPLNTDGTEFTDFVILLDDAYILIESKFIISSKATNINSALRKAVNQLSLADQQIKENTISLKNKSLEAELLKRKFNLKLCFHNDNIVLQESKCKALIANFRKNQLPMFISVMVFNQFLAALYIKNQAYFKDNLEGNLVTAFGEFYEGEKSILIFREFKAFGEDDNYFKS
jgi:hypothetical protein